MHQVPEAIGVLHGGVLVLETEEESNVLMIAASTYTRGKNLSRSTPRIILRRQDRGTRTLEAYLQANTDCGRDPGCRRVPIRGPIVGEEIFIMILV